CPDPADVETDVGARETIPPVKNLCVEPALVCMMRSAENARPGRGEPCVRPEIRRISMPRSGISGRGTRLSTPSAPIGQTQVYRPETSVTGVRVVILHQVYKGRLHGAWLE